MGLLDEAIREHLELKRLRGADPGEVAREQREALAGVEGEVKQDPLLEVSPPEVGFESSIERDVTEQHDVVGQDTAEVDMSVLLEADATSRLRVRVLRGRLRAERRERIWRPNMIQSPHRIGRSSGSPPQGQSAACTVRRGARAGR